jgi:hypothetical protein
MKRGINYFFRSYNFKYMFNFIIIMSISNLDVYMESWVAKSPVKRTLRYEERETINHNLRPIGTINDSFEILSGKIETIEPKTWVHSKTGKTIVSKETEIWHLAKGTTLMYISRRRHAGFPPTDEIIIIANPL